MPTNASDIRARASDLYKKGEYAAAATLYHDLCKIEPENVEGWIKFGSCNQKLRNIAVAEQALRKALELDPKSMPALTHLAATIAMSGDLQAAESLYREIVKRQPANFIAWLQLGETLLRLNRPGDALQACKEANRLKPGNINIMMTLGKAYHISGEKDKALECMQQVVEIKPDHVSAYDAIAWLLYEFNKPEEAIEIYRKRLRHTPEHGMTYFYLAQVLQETGRFEEAESAFRDAIRYKPDHQKAYSGLGYLLRKQNKPAGAIEIYRSLLSLNPTDDSTHIGIGNALRELGNYQEAEESYKSAIGLNPDNTEHLMSLARLYQSNGNHDQALDYLRRILSIDPHNAAAHTRMGRIFYTLGRHEEAESSFRRALLEEPESNISAVGLAATLLACGRHEEASEYCNQSLRRQPDNTEASALAAQIAIRKGESEQAYNLLEPLLGSDDLSDNVIMAFADVSRDTGRVGEATQLLEQALEKYPDRSPETLLNLHFCLGKLYDGIGEYDNAFHHYQLGNSLKQVSFEPLLHELEVDSFIAQHTWQFMASLPRASVRSERPVFITGMPRSGTTLVEQILSSHPDVYGAGELDDIGIIANSLPGTVGTDMPFAQALPLVNTGHLDILAKKYLERLEQLSPDAKRITDKMLGFIYLGLIELMLPSARIIHCVRNPMDTCLSGYFQDFSKNHPYSYDLRNLGLYYRCYRKIMQNWKNVLINVPIMEVQYEDLVADQENVSRKLVDFCNLPWDDRCLRFHENKRFVGTASFDQVRRPMYKSSSGRWKNYEKHLGELKDALGDIPDIS